jgi:outer membrane lipoprotein LolB
MALVVAFMVGCASPPKPVSTADAPAWSGRLSIKIDAADAANAPPAQQTSAGFTLSGNPQAGQLDLFTPLGGKAAQVVWGAGFAALSDGKTERRFPSLEAALESATGAKIPISNLFDWLQGKQDKALEASIGWEADLTRLAAGRLMATRLQPLPRVELRVVLEQ